MTLADGNGAGSGHRDGLVGFAGGFRAPFGRYWLSGFLSDFGNGVRLAAFPLLVTQVTREPAAAVLIHEAGLVLIYVAAFGVGTGAALRGTAAVACVPRLVEPSDLDKANGRVIAGQIVGNELAGPAAGGWLFGMAAVLPFAVNAGTLGIAVLLLLTLPDVFAPPPRQHEPGPGRARFSSVRHDLGEALAWMRQHPAIRDITIMAGVIAAMDATWFAVLVLYVIKILHQQPGTYGLLLAIGAVGGVLAGSGGAALTRRMGPWHVLLMAGLAVAATQAGLGLTGNVIIAAALLMLSSAAFALFSMTAVTMLQREVPDAQLGRVNSVFGTATQGAEALGAIAGGLLATAAGIRALMLVGAVPMTMVTVTMGWRHRGGGQ